MMNGKDYLYSTGKFAQLNGINKRTLRYYDAIGLFSPEYKAENGYRYYTCFQTVQLELILTLRGIGLSIDDIRRYLHSPSAEAFLRITTEQQQLIDRYIQRLQEAHALLERKVEKLKLGLAAKPGAVELVTLPEQQILLSEPISGRYDDADFAVAGRFSLRLRSRFGLYDNFGSRISAENILRGDYHGYDRFFACCRADTAEHDELRSGGRYLGTVFAGGWDSLGGAYDLLRSYAEQHRMTLTGYAYEEGLNEMSLQKQEEYQTMILVGVELPVHKCH